MALFRICFSIIFLIIFKSLVYSSDYKMILLTSDRGLLISDDSGKTWEDFNQGLPEKIIPFKIFSGNSAGMYLTTKCSGVYEFNYKRSFWIDVNSDQFLEPSFLSRKKRYRKISAFFACNDKKNTLLLATKHSIFRKHSGTGWKKLGGYSSENYYTALAYKSGSEFFAGTSYKGLYRIGKSKPVNLSKGLPNESYSKSRKFYEEISEIEFDEKENKIIYAGLNFGGGIFISNDIGKSWSSLDFPHPKDTLNDIHDLKSYNNSLFVSADSGIYRMDESRQWYSFSFQGMSDLASEKKNLAVLIIDKSKKLPPLFYRFNKYNDFLDNSLLLKIKEKKAIYANPYSFDKKFSSYIKTIQTCGFNAIVIDMKDDWGDICFQTKNKTAKEIGAVKVHVKNLNDVLVKLKKENIYSIARIVVFKDKRLYQAYNSKYAVWDKKKNKPWKGNSREYWNDPYSEFVQDYNIEIAYELQELGFDEIQFDYIRFPSDGPLWKCLYKFKKDDNIYKSEILAAFLQKAKNKLDIPISLDIYGFNTWFRFGNIIGQDVEKFSETADVICPMIYPSHYGKSFFKDLSTAEKPYRIVLENTKRAVKIIGNRAVVRPYIQGFNLLSPTWGPDYIRDQIKAVYKGGCNGFTFWNAGGKYDMVEKTMTGKKSVKKRDKSASSRKEK